MTTPTTTDPWDDLLKQPEYAALVLRVRNFLRDYWQINRLIKGDEHKDRDILFAVSYAVDDINSTPPPIVKTVPEMIHIGWAGLIILGASIYLMRSVGMHYIRNNLPFNDGNLQTAGLSAKWPEIVSWLDRIDAAYENKKKLCKVSANLAGMMSMSPVGVSSEFAIVHGLERFYW